MLNFIFCSLNIGTMKILVTLTSLLALSSYSHGQCQFFRGAMCPLEDENIVGFDNDVIDILSCQNLYDLTKS